MKNAYLPLVVGLIISLFVSCAPRLPIISPRVTMTQVLDLANCTSNKCFSKKAVNLGFKFTKEEPFLQSKLYKYVRTHFDFGKSINQKLDFYIHSYGRTIHYRTLYTDEFYDILDDELSQSGYVISNNQKNGKETTTTFTKGKSKIDLQVYPVGNETAITVKFNIDN